MKTLLIILITLAATRQAAAQDPLFTQTFHSPVYTNPALSGTGRAEWRLSGVSRLQWMRIPSQFRYFSLAAEKQFTGAGAAVAVMVNRSNEGYLRTNGVFSILSKEINFSESTYFNFAIQTGLVWRSLNLEDYLFADQIDRNGIIPGVGSGMEAQPSGGNFFLDVSPGFVFTWKNLMIGGAAQHFYNTDQGIFGDRNRLQQRRYTMHANFLIDTDEGNEESVKIKPAVYVNLQGRSTRLQAGAQLMLSSGVEINAWYQNNISLAQANSFSLGVNLRLGRSRNYYNADAGRSGQFGVSGDRELTNGLPNRTFGSFELGGIYEVSTEACPKPYDGRDLKKYPWAFQ